MSGEESVESAAIEAALADHFGWAMHNATACSVADFLYDWFRECRGVPRLCDGCSEPNRCGAGCPAQGRPTECPDCGASGLATSHDGRTLGICTTCGGEGCLPGP